MTVVLEFSPEYLFLGFTFFLSSRRSFLSALLPPLPLAFCFPPSLPPPLPPSLPPPRPPFLCNYLSPLDHSDDGPLDFIFS